MGGTNGRPPAATTMLRVASVRFEPSASATSTVHGEVIRALPCRQSTPSAV